MAKKKFGKFILFTAAVTTAAAAAYYYFQKKDAASTQQNEEDDDYDDFSDDLDESDNTNRTYVPLKRDINGNTIPEQDADSNSEETDKPKQEDSSTATVADATNAMTTEETVTLADSTDPMDTQSTEESVTTAFDASSDAEPKSDKKVEEFFDEDEATDEEPPLPEA